MTTHVEARGLTEPGEDTWQARSGVKEQEGTKFATRDRRSAFTIKALSLIVFFSVAIFEALLTVAVMVTGTIALVHRSSDMAKSSGAFLLCVLLVPLVGQHTIDHVTGDHEDRRFINRPTRRSKTEKNRK